MQKFGRMNRDRMESTLAEARDVLMARMRGEKDVSVRRFLLHKIEMLNGDNPCQQIQKPKPREARDSSPQYHRDHSRTSTA